MMPLISSLLATDVLSLPHTLRDRSLARRSNASPAVSITKPLYDCYRYYCSKRSSSKTRMQRTLSIHQPRLPPGFWQQGAKNYEHRIVAFCLWDVFELLFWTKRTWSPLLVRVLKGRINTQSMDMGTRRGILCQLAMTFSGAETSMS